MRFWLANTCVTNEVMHQCGHAQLCIGSALQALQGEASRRETVTLPRDHFL